MKILIKLLILKIISVVLITFTIYEFNKNNLDVPIKHAIEYYLKFKGFESKVINLKIIDNQIKIESIKASKANVIFTLENIVINNKFHFNYKSSKFGSNISIERLKASLDNTDKIITDLEFFSSKLFFSYENYFVKRKSVSNLTLEEILYQDAFSDEQNKMILRNGKAIIKNTYNKNIDYYDFNINFNDENSFYAKGMVNDDIIFDGSIKNFPLMLYKPAYYIHPTNDLMIFLNSFIKTGIVESSEFHINLGKNGKNSILASSKINHLSVLYDDDLPRITNMQVDVTQSGMITEFKINNANSGDIKIYDGLILMDWKERDKTVLTLTAKAQGPANALSDFIPSDTYTNLQKANIDFKKITGHANININLKIPLKHGSEDIYDITADILNGDLSIFKDQVTLTNSRFSARYNAKTLILSGNGKINELDSNIDFIQNFTDKSLFDHKLTIVTDMNISKKMGFLNITDGSAKLNFEYLSHNNKNLLSLNSKLNNLSFSLDKLAIHKNKGEEANLRMNGELQNASKANIKFNLTGANNLDASGMININDKKFDILIDKLTHKHTSFSSKITIEKDLVDINLKGETLDLSSANMIDLLEKERDAGATKMNLSIAKVNLKNNVIVDGLNMNFECNSSKCYSGKIDGLIGSKPINIQLKEDGLFEKWIINSENAGALLLGFGMYNDMRAGALSIEIKTTRKEVRVGEVIPVLNGHYIFTKFVLHDAPSLSKLVSVVSLPGFVRMISGNKDIIFLKMTGDFTFQQGVLSIFDSIANGPFFDFTMNGNINTINRTIDLKGHVNPSLYGASSIIGSIPFFGKIFTGDKKHRGFISAPYVMKEKY